MWRHRFLYQIRVEVSLVVILKKKEVWIKYAVCSSIRYNVQTSNRLPAACLQYSSTNVKLYKRDHISIYFIMYNWRLFYIIFNKQNNLWHRIAVYKIKTKTINLLLYEETSFFVIKTNFIATSVVCTHSEVARNHRLLYINQFNKKAIDPTNLTFTRRVHHSISRCHVHDYNNFINKSFFLL